MYKRILIAAFVLATTSGCVHNQARPEGGLYKVGDYVVLPVKLNVTRCQVAENSVTAWVGSPLFKRCIGGPYESRDNPVIEVLKPPVTFKVTKVFSDCMLGGCNEYTVVEAKDTGKRYIVLGGASAMLKPVQDE